jgi:hypothetical protein
MPSLETAEELGDRGGHRIVDASEGAASVGETVLDAGAVDPKSHGFSAAMDAHNLSLYGARPVRRAVVIYRVPGDSAKTSAGIFAWVYCFLLASIRILTNCRAQ